MLSALLLVLLLTMTACYERYPYFLEEPEIYVYDWDPGVGGWISIYTDNWQNLIRYTTDGSDPTEDYGTIYYDSFYLSAETYIRATSYREGYSAGPIAEYYFVP
jgi:hypothetical protein